MRDSNEAGQPPHTPQRSDEREVTAPASDAGTWVRVADVVGWAEDVHHRW